MRFESGDQPSTSTLSMFADVSVFVPPSGSVR